ncbi:MAG: LptA/OstA family protein [Candidatus Glassbacteria bacterium]
MSSATSSRLIGLICLVWLFLPAGLRQTFGRTPQEPDSLEAAVPFTIRQADHFFQRRDSTGLQTYLLQGNVHVTRGGSVIKCDNLTYFPVSSYFLCTGRVLVADTSRSLNSDSLFYYVDSGYYRALGGLRWSSGELSGTGELGEYWRDRDVMTVTGRAVACDSLRRIEADRLAYDYRAERLEASGAVRLTDSQSGSTAVAAGAVYRRAAGESTLTGRPVVTYYTQTDTLKENPYKLTGDRIVSWRGDSLAAVGRVKLSDDSLTVTADSLFYDRSRDVSYFRGGPPLIEHPKYKLHSRLLDVFTTGRALQRICATGGGRGEFFLEKTKAETPDSAAGTGTGCWIEGDSLELFFGESGLDSICSAGGARSYFREGAETGINYLLGDRILLIWQGGALEVVEVTRGGRGLYLPADTGGAITVIPDSAGFRADSSKLRKR